MTAKRKGRPPVIYVAFCVECDSAIQTQWGTDDFGDAPLTSVRKTAKEHDEGYEGNHDVVIYKALPMRSTK